MLNDSPHSVWLRTCSSELTNGIRLVSCHSFRWATPQRGVIQHDPLYNAQCTPSLTKLLGNHYGVTVIASVDVDIIHAATEVGDLQ